VPSSTFARRAAALAGGLAIAGAGAAWLLHLAALASLMATELHMNDFGKFYYSTMSFVEGGDMYGPSPATRIQFTAMESREFLNMNPPHFHLLTLPLAAVGPLTALWLWTIASVAALVASLRVVARELRIVWTPARIGVAVIGTLVCSATVSTVVTGQLTFLLLLPVTLAWASARGGRWNRSAVYLGVCASVKPFLGIFIVYFLLRRRSASVLMMAASGLATGAVGLVVFGWDAYMQWLGALSAVDWTGAPMNGALAALSARAFSETPFYTPIVHAPAVVGPLNALLAASVAAASLWLFWRDDSHDRVDRAFAGLLLTALLISPLGWVYYLWLLLGPAAALYQSSRARRSRLRDRLVLLAIPGLIVPYGVTILWSSAPWIGLTLGSIYVWTLVFLWLATVADGRAAYRRSAAVASPMASVNATLSAPCATARGSVT
jgi:hypothetical protein